MWDAAAGTCALCAAAEFALPGFQVGGRGGGGGRGGNEKECEEVKGKGG